MMLTGRDVAAEEAERIGLVSRAVERTELLDVCFDMAERIASFSRPGIELTKRTLWSGLDATSLEGTCRPRVWDSFTFVCSPATSKKRSQRALNNAPPRSSPTTSR